MQVDILRDNFLEFFKSKGHQIVESDSLVPQDDPTILFTPAGMNQFKKQFLGQDIDFKRAATSQRCLRTDDLDQVGKTPGHHTFFEMLGNFSFGDYFKEAAIALAWEFLTKNLKIKKEKLWVSVYKDDPDAYKIWKDKIKVPQEKIIKLGDKENFWPSEAKKKGPHGPCGPCSEIFFDQGSSTGCGRKDCHPACSCNRFVEVWNLVFTQYNYKEGGILEPLPRKNIDTGMGLERLAAVMQGVSTNFETDLFQPIIKEIVSSVRCQVSGGKGLIYALADHLRAIAFAIYDGVLPSNESRGYVIRKLIRKSTLHLRTLGVKKPFLYKLVPVLSEIMKKPYPGLDARRENIAAVILAEEEGFIATLNSSPSLWKEKFSAFLKKQDPAAAGKIAFQLYDTYGIPWELTKDWLDKQKIKISHLAFDKELAQQKTRSKLQSAMKGEVFDVKGLDLGIKETLFLGYKDYMLKAKIMKIIKDNAALEEISKADKVKIVLDQTVFYPESGGQVGDRGEILKGKNRFEVLDTQKIGKVIVHIGQVKTGIFQDKDAVSLKIDKPRRLAIAKNHTATHLLQTVLRKVLGDHIRQQGSLVAQDKLRFDFTHFKSIDKEQLDRIEEMVNGYIAENYSLSVKQMPLSEARKAGALAFFAEKYAEQVRMVSVGDFSKELCAGTHLDSTGQIGLFKITNEESVAAGIRRIEAVTGDSAYKIVKENKKIIRKVAKELNVAPDKISQELEKRADQIKILQKQLNTRCLDIVRDSIDTFIADADKIKEMKVISRYLEHLDMDLLRKTVDLIKEKTDNSIIALGSDYQGRALLVVGITVDLVQEGLDAAKLILAPAGVLGGSGGGRKDFAQAGGTKPENFQKAFAELKNTLRA